MTNQDDAAGPRRRHRHLSAAVATVVVSIVVSALAIWLLAGSVDVPAAVFELRRADPPLMVLALATLTASIICRAVRWRVVLPAIKGQPAPSVLVLAAIFCIGYLANSVLPLRAGEPIRAAILAAHSRVDAARALGSIGLERILDAIALGMVMMATATALRAPSWLTTSGLVVLALAAGVLGAIFVIGHAGILELAHRRAHSVVRPVLGALARVAEGARGQSMLRVGAGLALSILVWMIDATTFWVLSEAISLGLTWPGAALIAGACAVATILPAAPAFIGTFELAGTAAGTALGLPPHEALALTLLAHVVTTAPVALAGGASVLALAPSVRRRRRGS